MKKLLTTMAFSAHSAISLAQGYLDSFNINKGVFNKNSTPGSLTAVGNTLYFAATDSIHGRELWAMFGNATFPMRLTDIQKDANNSVSASTQGPFGIIGDEIFFSGYDTTHGYELWFYNSGGGTGLIKDINDGQSGIFPLSSMPNYLTVYKDKLYFSAADTTYGSELWVHQPYGKTERLTDINPGKLAANPRDLCIFNDKLYFMAFNLDSGAELFQYDPATATSKIVADIYPGSAGSSPSNMCTCDNKLFFFANDDTHGRELFSYDGTNPPALVKDLAPGTNTGATSAQAGLACYKNKIYFNGMDNGKYELMEYDPQTDQMSVVHQFGTPPFASYLTVFNDELYFVAANPSNGRELWKYNTIDTPVRITDIAPGPQTPNIYYITATTHALFFTATGGGMGQELFRYSPYAKVGIENMRFNGTASIYPNPAKDITTLKLSLNENQSLNIVLTDMSGRTVYQTGYKLYSAAEHNIRIPLNNLPTGSYTYSILDKEGAFMLGNKLQKL